MNERRREIASYYKNNLSKRLILNKDSNQHYHSYHLFPIRLPDDMDRDLFIDKLKENNIGSSVHFIPLHLHTFYKDRSDEEFEVSDKVFEKILSIPMCSVMSDQEVEYVTKTINNILG